MANATDTMQSGGTHTHNLSGTAESAGAHFHDVTGATASIGSGTAHNNVSRALVGTWYIKL